MIFIYVVRSKSGVVFKHLVGDKKGEEIEYKTFELAQEACERYQKGLLNQEFFVFEKKIGRPSLGVTKKVSLTLTDDEWLLFDEKAEGNRSNYVRNLVKRDLGTD